jgi:hypothetical protein
MRRLAALILLTGCTEGTWYPEVWTEDVFPDTSPPDTGEDGLPCTPLEGPWPPGTLVAQNLTPDRVEVFWRGADCTEATFGTVEPGAELRELSTGGGYVWVARETSGAYVDHLVTVEGPNLWEIR